MSCHCCVKLVRILFDRNGISADKINIGEALISIDTDIISLDQVSEILENEGFEVMRDKEKKLVEQLKSAIIHLVHHTTANAMVRNSDYLVEKFGLSYQYMSMIFSKQTKTTLEKYIISQKIEKAKQLIQSGDLSLSEIAYIMGYSSVQYLSTQFKTVTGVSVSEFKKDPVKYLNTPNDFR